MKIWVDIVSAIAQIGIAASVAYVAWQNYKINRSGYYLNKDQLRLSLFDRRYKVFDAFRTLLVDFSITAKVDLTKFSKFTFDTLDTEFLFGKEVVAYRQKIIDNLLRLRLIHNKLEKGPSNDEERERLAKEMETLEEWLANQDESVEALFRKYLRFAINADPD